MTKIMTLLVMTSESKPEKSFPLSFQFKLHAFISRGPATKSVSRLFLSTGNGNKAGFLWYNMSHVRYNMSHGII